MTTATTPLSSPPSKPFPRSSAFLSTYRRLSLSKFLPLNLDVRPQAGQRPQSMPVIVFSVPPQPAESVPAIEMPSSAIESTHTGEGAGAARPAADAKIKIEVPVRTTTPSSSDEKKPLSQHTPPLNNLTPPQSPKISSSQHRTSNSVTSLLCEEKGGIELRLPDMFASIMAVEPRQNPHVRTVKPEAEEWIARTLKLSEKQARRNGMADFTFLVSWWAPNADAEALRTMVDWQHWAFPWDDLFDEGYLKEDLAAAAEDIIHMTSILDDSYPEIPADTDKPIRYAFQQNWYRIRKRASISLQHRYKMYLKHYMLGVLGQVSSRARDPRSLSVDDYLRFRRGTIGAMPCFCLVEYAEGIDLPQHVVEHPSIAACQEVAVDLVLIDNDVLSYKKDLREGEELNLVNVLRHSRGLTLQEALDEIDAMLTQRYRRWYRALAELPSWGYKVDREVLRYLDGCRNVALGSLVWSFHTGRYFKGDEGERVRTQQRMWVPQELLKGLGGEFEDKSEATSSGVCTPVEKSVGEEDCRPALAQAVKVN